MVEGRCEANPASPAWAYRRVGADDIVEVCRVRGRAVALPPHFHDEDQVTIVLSGRRRFRLPDGIVTVEAGGCALIRAGVVHLSLDEPAGVEGINLYLPAGDYASSAMASEVGRLWRDAAGFELGALMAVVRTHRLRPATSTPARVASRCGVAQRAARAGVSREGFSRAFVREHGMPPHAFGLVARLNQARGLLRDGAPLVDVAVDSGFADQSHLGRCFRRTFGVTPGQYRAGKDQDGRSQKG